MENIKGAFLGGPILMLIQFFLLGFTLTIGSPHVFLFALLHVGCILVTGYYNNKGYKFR